MCASSRRWRWRVCLTSSFVALPSLILLSSSVNSSRSRGELWVFFLCVLSCVWLSLETVLVSSLDNALLSRSVAICVKSVFLFYSSFSSSSSSSPFPSTLWSSKPRLDWSTGTKSIYSSSSAFWLPPKSEAESKVSELYGLMLLSQSLLSGSWSSLPPSVRAKGWVVAAS